MLTAFELQGRTSVGNSATQSHKRQQTSSERSLDASSGYGNLAAGAQADNQGSGQQQAAQIITSDTPVRTEQVLTLASLSGIRWQNSDWAVNLLMQSVAASDQGQPPLPSSTPSLELATNDQIFLQGDVFGTGVMMCVYKARVSVPANLLRASKANGNLVRHR